MTPAQVHMTLDVELSAGLPPISTVGEPGTQGAGRTGTHGAGVKTPRAAEVAAITAGFVGAEHIPNEAMFFMGTLSMMVAAGRPPARTLLSGVTTSGTGATPNEQAHTALLTTCCAMRGTSVSGLAASVRPAGVAAHV